MTLAERLSEYVRAALHRPLGPVVRARRRDRRDRPALPPAGLGAGHLGHRPRPGPRRPGRRTRRTAVSAADPLAAIRALGALATPDGTALLVLRNFHRFLGTVEVVQALDTADRRRQAGPDLRRRPLPGRADPRRAGEAVRRHRARPARPRPARARSPAAIATEPGELPEGDGLDAVLDAAAGLTRVEAENAFSLSLVRHGRVAPDVLWELKAPDAEEERPADPAPRRRDLRRPGRPGGPQGVLHAAPCGRAAGPMSGPAACSCSAPPGSGKSRRSARPWATRPAGRR